MHYDQVDGSWDIEKPLSNPADRGGPAKAARLLEESGNAVFFTHKHKRRQ